MRPAVFQVGGVLYWVLQTRNPDTMVLTDADTTPSVAVRKNGASVADSVTITKRSATTGIYDCSYNPAAEVEGDSFTLEESATITGTTTSSATYTQAWNARVVAVERGTDSANTTTPPTVGAIADQVWDEARAGHVTAGTFGEGVVLDSAAILAVADQVWDEATSGHTISDTYGGRIVRATNSNVEVQITGSNHVAADVHELQSGVITAGDFAANAITASALAADAVTEIQSGLATAANLLIVNDGVGFITAVLVGTISNAGTATESYAETFNTAVYTVAFTGLDATGNRTGVTRTKV